MSDVGETNRFVYEFGVFRLDPMERLLLRNGQPVRLQAKAFNILVILVTNCGHLVPKEELMSSVWPEAFVEENNLTKNIYALRQVLNAGGGQWIETVPRQGYRFTADVHRLLLNIQIEKTTNLRLLVREEVTDETGGRAWPYLGAGALLLVLLAFGLGLMRPTFTSSSGSAATGQTNPEALELYEQGLRLWKTRDAADLHRATILLERAVILDPGFAGAHAALADAYAFSFTNWMKAEAEATRAIELDQSSGHPHATIGFVRMYWDWKLVSAETEFKKAIELAPEDPTSHQWYALNLVARGDGEAAGAEMRQALALEPDSVSINADLCQVYYFQHRFADAQRQCEQAIQLEPSLANVHSYLYDIYVAEEEYATAVEKYRDIEHAGARNVSGKASAAEQRRQEAFARDGMRGFWTALADEYSSGAPQYYKLARVKAQLGELREALRLLSLAHDTRDFDLVFLAVDPVFDRLHKDNTFGQLRLRLMQ